MKVNDGASADIRISMSWDGKFIDFVIDGQMRRVTTNDACRIMMVFTGCSEEEHTSQVPQCTDKPMYLMHQLEPYPAYMLYNWVDGRPDGLLAVIKPHEVLGLRAALEQMLAKAIAI